MRIDTTIHKGIINDALRVSYVYSFEPAGKFQTIREKENGNVTISQSFGISISEGFDKARIYLPANKYYPFATLMEKTVNNISKNLYEIFPNVGKLEFDVDSRALERFQTEKALNVAGMTAIPTVWSDSTGMCYPAIKINIVGGSVSIPLEDAISISSMLNKFDPFNYAISLLRVMGKIN